MNLGDRIRSYRIRAGLKQSDLANILHVTPQAVSNWERNERIPDLDLFPLLSKTLTISYSELLDGRDIDFFPVEQKELLLNRCLATASVANKLCKMLDRWEQEDLEIQKLEDEELIRRGIDISCPFRQISELDPLGLAEKKIMKKKNELSSFIKENGETAMAYVLMILYLGEDIAHGSWELPDVKDPCYRDNVCNLLLTDQDDYHRIDYPYYEITDKFPELVASWIRDGLCILIKAV